MQTRSGGSKVRETMIRKLGSKEAYSEWMRELGRMGGEKSTGGGFGYGEIGRQRASKYGAIGGAKSKRGPAK